MSARERPLGMRRPTDDRHIQRYSLTADYMPTVPTSCVAGTNWYSRFDTPHKDGAGHYWMIDPAQSNLGTLRGGHAWCLNGFGIEDVASWWRYYDQPDGSCVGFAWSRAMSHMNRVRYQAHWLYEQAQVVDEWTDTPPEEGTSVRAGADVLRAQGHLRTDKALPQLSDGISANRWIRSIDDLAACLSPRDTGARILNRGWTVMRNSWGEDYPHTVRVDLDLVFELVFRQDGEIGVMTDR